MPSSSKKIVELCGLPGVGKTTVARKLVMDAHYSRVILVARLHIMGYFLLGLCRHPLLFSRGCLFALRNTSSLTEFWSYYVYRYARFAKAYQSTDTFCVLDEGPRQSIFGYALSKVDRAHLVRLWSESPPVGLVVVLSVPEDVRRKQLAERGVKRPKNSLQEQRELSDDLLRAEKVIREVAQTDRSVVFVRSVTEAKQVIEKFYAEQ